MDVFRLRIGEKIRLLARAIADLLQAEDDLLQFLRGNHVCRAQRVGVGTARRELVHQQLPVKWK